MGMIPKAAVKMLLGPIARLCRGAYQQGKEDFEKDEYNEKDFEKEIKKKIMDNI